MSIFDGTTSGIVESQGRYILPVFEPSSDATFKASYVVASDMKCTGKITALFDLTVLGNIEAAEIEVKGKLVCTGRCDVSGTIIVQNEIWCDDIHALSIDSHEKVMAQEIEVTSIKTEGSIMVSKVLSVEKLAETDKCVLCGETVFGAGKVIAKTLITGEPLDLFEGEAAVLAPMTYKPQQVPQPKSGQKSKKKLIEQGKTDYAPLGDWRGFLQYLIESSNKTDKQRFQRWEKVLDVVCSDVNSIYDIAFVVWFSEISNSIYFREWKAIQAIADSLCQRFIFLDGIEKNNIVCSIEEYSEWIRALNLLRVYGDRFDETIYKIAFEKVVGQLGLKAKFMVDRLNEKGWKAHG